MTNEKAIEILVSRLSCAVDYNSYYVDSIEVEAVELAIKALQKQVPIKPKAENFGFSVRESCPVCDDSVDCGEIYCSYCGQLIDWSDEE